ncbi:MAG: hypothetical protein K6E40_03160 [Desulfovibrio sp.]|nr:hypothetical protein [Desulfovibrio sp.]
MDIFKGFIGRMEENARYCASCVDFLHSKARDACARHLPRRHLLQAVRHWNPGPLTLERRLPMRVPALSFWPSAGQACLLTPSAGRPDHLKALLFAFLVSISSSSPCQP